MSTKKQNHKEHANQPYQRTADYDPNRHCYVDEEGNYVFEVWDDEAKQYIKGDVLDADVDREWVIFLDTTDHDEDLQVRYANENMDYGMENKRRKYASQQTDEEYDEDPFEQIPAAGAGPEDILFKEEEPEDPRVAELLEYMQKLTAEQVDLIYALFGEQKKLREIAEEIVKADGTHPTPQAIKGRENKITNRLRKLFGIDQ